MKGLSALTQQLRKHRDCETIVQLKPPPSLLPSVPSSQIYTPPFIFFFFILKNFLKLIRKGLLSNTSYLKHRFPNGLFTGLHSS